MKALLTCLLLLGCTLIVHAQPKHVNTKNGIALHGYDAVSYLDKNQAEAGTSTHTAVYEGVTYHFASTANREKFIKNPSHYLPAYGGYCAFAMGDYGEKVDVDPKTFKVIGGKVYLFYNFFVTNTLTSWNKAEPKLKAAADVNWAKLTATK
jgi:YHS domain-containing protein